MYQSAYLSLVDAIVDMESRGFQYDFTWRGSRLFCSQFKCFLNAGDFEVIEMYHFAAGENLEKETIIYGIRSKVNSIKGILMSTILLNNGSTVSPAAYFVKKERIQTSIHFLPGIYLN